MQAVTAQDHRHKRLSHEEEDDNSLFPSPQATVSHLSSMRTALVATFFISFVWFGKVVAPLLKQASEGVVAQPVPLKTPMNTQELGLLLATGRGFLSNYDITQARQASQLMEVVPPHTMSKDGLSPFVMTCAIVHTVIVCVGLGLGRDTRVLTAWEKYAPLVRGSIASFAFFCAALYWAWKFNVGPVPAAFSSTITPNVASFVLVGASELSVWLGAAMLVPHSPMGDKVASSTAFHGLLTAVASGMALLDISVSGSLATFGLAGSMGLGGSILASRVPSVRASMNAWNI